ncbi:dihydrolipoamide acetyltransferase family protein [Rhodococcus jostii]|uniref:Dihydrolipoamide acetyltransferase component of pyruvate dehydrogenase complex n=1 Tax=Rhodococcus jostii TaxID=132919 RepID=A0A1H4IRL6_RHOJO|nr:dihydrolipoamide acetyltransferase family protein [Rhodococcus jostii]SEB36699.1 pyruvate dehydrogenase E2 component (dihydrolipoamide acetyltransferase) [Rhodococcus jostii]
MSVESFQLPDLGEGLTEAELISWLVKVGDTIELNQIIAEVETAKASVELPSPYAGTVVALKAVEGTTMEVGAPIIEISVGNTAELAPSAGADPQDQEARGHEAEERVPVLVGYGVSGASASRRRGKRRPQEDAPANPTSATASVERGTERPAAKPPVRFLAKQKGIDLAAVSGTGPDGRITRSDVLGYEAAHTDAPSVMAKAGPATLPAVAGQTTETRTPVKGVRRHTADAMVRSAFTAPHVTEFITFDITRTVELLSNLRASQAFADIKLTPLALVAKALVVALRDNPSLNSYWDEHAQEIVTKHYVNLGIAAATPRGLMVPNIKDADRLGLRDLAKSLVELTRTAKEGKTSPADLAGGTITITNVGVFGVDAGTPILNPGEAAILCFGAIRKQPWEFEGEVALRSVTTLSLSFDHRLVDGEQGSRFLSDIAAMLSDPLQLIALS